MGLESCSVFLFLLFPNSLTEITLPCLHPNKHLVKQVTWTGIISTDELKLNLLKTTKLRFTGVAMDKAEGGDVRSSLNF